MERLLYGILLISILQLAFAAKGSRIPSFAGPVKVIGKFAGSCPEELVGKNVHRTRGCIIKETREKQHSRLYCTFESLEPFNDSNQLSFQVASWSRVSGWVPNYFIFRFEKLCTECKRYLVRVLEKYKQYSNTQFCPRGPSNFTLDGVPAFYVPDRKLFAAFPYGRFRVDASILKKSDILGCVRISFDAVPLVKQEGN